ncbi:OmpA family protein [Aquamicrobium segne]|uniref:OmpA family protein n=1 Tax=Aquamicrobium segne TaxID=469547 RepID=A0ABW0GWB0_9HYPH
MFNRRSFTTALIATMVLPGAAFAQGQMPSAARIERQLDASPRKRIAPNQRVTVQEFKRRADLRRAAPSIDIQSINFNFGSADISASQYHKVEAIADAMKRILRRDRRASFLIEGHTDAVGSNSSNLLLSQRRAATLRQLLIRRYNVPSRALETVGYGEEFLLVPTQNENWQNRRVTLRRIDSFIR